MTKVMGTEEFLAHYGVKGMKWGVHRERRLQNTIARNKTRAGLRDINSKKVTNNDADIHSARAALPGAKRKLADAKDQYKVDKHTMNRIDARRPKKLAAAELRRINEQAERLTGEELRTYHTMQLGRAVGDLFLGSENKRSDIQREVDKYRDREAARKLAEARRR